MNTSSIDCIGKMILVKLYKKVDVPTDWEGRIERQGDAVWVISRVIGVENHTFLVDKKIEEVITIEDRVGYDQQTTHDFADKIANKLYSRLKLNKKNCEEFVATIFFGHDQVVAGTKLILIYGAKSKVVQSDYKKMLTKKRKKDALFR